MKKSILFLLLIFGSWAMAGNWTGFTSHQPATAGVSLVSSNAGQSVIHFNLKGYSATPVQTPHGEAMVISTGKATPIQAKGAPDLAKLTASVIIPDRAKMEVEIVSSEYKEYYNVEVAPSKGNLYRNIDPATVPYAYGKEYTTNSFYPGTLATLRDPFVLRDYRGQTVVVYPFQYNPVTKVLRVYSDIEVKVYASAEERGTNILQRKDAPAKINAEFKNIYKNLFLNTPETDVVDEQGRMLVICYNQFMSAMQPFVDWKNQEGIYTEIVDVSTIGNATAIKNYITNYYNANDLAFVLLVGDAAQVPTLNASGGSSDNSYSYIVGNDHYPDLFVGRFSAENIQHVETQVSKVLNYEKNPVTIVDWFSNGLGIGSDQGPGDDGEYDWQHIRNIRTKLMGYTYTAVSELYDGSQGGLDQPGNPTPAMVASEINAGRGIINYTGHGSQTSWGTTGFSNSNVTALTNDNMLPFIFSVACVNGQFANGTCFAEAWLRATHNGQPSGAVATLMSTINQSWNPPMCGEDAMNDILVETYPANIKRTFGGITMNGCMLMNDEYGADGAEMTDTWNIFGDPSLMVRTKMPVQITANHSSTLTVGSTEIQITSSNAISGLVALTIDNQIIGTTNLVMGGATVAFPALTQTGTVHMVITSFNKIPYIVDIPVVNAVPANITFNKFTINDSNGNNNGQADYSENILLNITLENTGGTNATNVTAILTTEDPYATITDNTENYGTIAAGEQSGIADGFAFTVANNIPDAHEILFTINSTDGINTWASNFYITAYAPVLSAVNIRISDPAGNNNGRLDDGETAQVIISSTNQGHSDATALTAALTSAQSYLTILDSPVSLPLITVNDTAETSFTVQANQGIPVNGYAAFGYSLSCAGYQTAKNFSVPLAWIVEDFETGDFTKYDWQQGGNSNWTLTTTSPYEGIYSAKSGSITANQTSELLLSWYVEANDSIVFSHRASSESGDYLKFYIDDVQKSQWSGEIAWGKAAYPVTAGNHTLKWTYSKNASGNQGEDAAFIDLIRLPMPVTTTANAGEDATSCGITGYQLNGTATGYTSLEWTTSGNGMFSDLAILNPVYTPDASDVEAGNVTITLTANPGSDAQVSDQMVLSLTKTPVANAGLDATVCEGSTVQLNGVAENYSGILWTTSGNGTFDNPLSLNAIYTPGTEDISIRNVTLTLSATGNTPCGEANDAINLQINPLPTATLNGNATVCAGETVTLTINLTGTAPWSITSGNGEILTAEATPYLWQVNPENTSNYFITSVTDANGCNNSGSGTTTITVNPLPTSEISGTASVCEGTETPIAINLTGMAPWSVSLNDGQNLTITDTPYSFVVTPESSANYTIIEVTDANSCHNTGTGEAAITILSIPVIPVQPVSPDSVDSYQVLSTIFTIEEIPGTNSYDWQLQPENAGTISGNGTTATVTWNANFRGIASVKVKSINDCGESEYSAAKDIKVYSSLGIGEITNTNQVMVYPNPGNGIFFLKNDFIKPETVNISVVNSLGIVVHEEKSVIFETQKVQQLNLTGINTGMYYLQIRNAKTNISLPLIIK